MPLTKLIKIFLSTFTLMSRILLLLAVSQVFVTGMRLSNMRSKEKEILDNIIGPYKYDSRIRPSGPNSTQSEDGPCTVKVNIFVRSISKISDLDMEYSVQMTFREQWRDDRLSYDDLNGQLRYLTLTDPERIWKPDLFFRNEKEGHFHNIIMPNVLLRIYPDGEVLYSIRISLVLSCPMDLKYYPLDRQNCSISMASYGYTTEDLVFVWKETDPVQVTKNLHLPRFTLQRHSVDYCTSRTNTGEYSCIKVDLVFRREFSYYLIQIYIPCCMLVIVSWVSFWLDPNAIPARVSLGVTTLLTMATQISGINASLPPVSYTKAIDVWTGCCLTFVFGALLEFALVNYASRSDCHRAAAEAKLWQEAFISTQQDDCNQIQWQQRDKRNEKQRKQQSSKSQPATVATDNVYYQRSSGNRSSLRSTCSMLKNSTSVHSLTVDDQVTNELLAPDATINLLNSVGVTSNKKCPSTLGCGHFQSPSTSEYIFAPLSSPSSPGIPFTTISSHDTLDSRSNGPWNRWLSKFTTRSKRIDVISRIFFPIMFAFFNVVYWVTYLWRDDLRDSE